MSDAEQLFVCHVNGRTLLIYAKTLFEARIKAAKQSHRRIGQVRAYPA